MVSDKRIFVEMDFCLKLVGGKDTKSGFNENCVAMIIILNGDLN